MLGLFRSKPLLDANSTEWIFATYAWALRNLDAKVFQQHTQLITPSNEFFPDRIEDPAELATRLFERVRDLAGMSRWPCTLVVQEPDPNLRVARTLYIENAEQPPAGTFSVRGGEQPMATITYNPGLLRDPERFVATMAHELAHYLGASVDEQPPGGEEYHEHATDVLAVFIGFGLFQLNSTFRFRQFTDTATGTQGWSTQRLGYLTPAESAFALAVFCSLKNIPTDRASRFLQQPQQGLFRRAMKDMRQHQEALQHLLQACAQAPAPTTGAVAQPEL